MLLNRLSFLNMIYLSCIVGISISIYVYNKQKNIIIQLQENQLSTYDTIMLYVIRSNHYAVLFFGLFFPFLVKINILYDIIFIILSSLVYIQWYIFSECLITIKEKQILDPVYKNGDDIKYEPFIKALYDSSTFYNYIQSSRTCIFIFVIFRVLYNLVY
jgi:hypothetical protein